MTTLIKKQKVMKTTRLKYILFLGILLIPIHMQLHAQNITLDGVFDEAIWANSQQFSGFVGFKPEIGAPASEQTFVQVTNDSLFLYVGVSCYDREPDKIRANLTNRDNLKNDDTFTIEIDGTGSSNSNLFFRCNPIGIQEDGVVDQEEDDDLKSDKVWYSKGIITDKGYSIEFAIPFQSLRYTWEPEVTFNLGFRRKIFRKSETVVCPEYDPELSNRLMQRVTIKCKNVHKQKVIEAIPSVTYTYDEVNENGGWEENQNEVNFGITGKIGITSDLLIDLTYNPDFSQVESDAAKIDINLRSALYFSEKRPFFQEGLDQFSFGGEMFNTSLKNIVHTRNIVKPLYGVKLTGNLTDKTSIASIISTDTYSDSKEHYQILRLRHRFKSDNYFGAVYTGKESSLGSNRVGGGDGLIRLNGKNQIEYHLLRSFTDDTSGTHEGNNMGFKYQRKTKLTNLSLGYFLTDKDFNTEVGYLSRNGIETYAIMYNVNIPLKSKRINKLGIWINSYPRRDLFSNKFESWTYTGIELYFKNDSWIWFGRGTAHEVYQNQKFNTSDWGGGYYLQFNKNIYIEGYTSWGNRILYDPDNPYQGYGLFVETLMRLTPTNQLSFKLSGVYSNFYRSSDDSFIYDYTIGRLHASYQINKHLSVRTIGEYNFYHDNLGAEFLASFTYIPGTVIQLGYNFNAENTIPGEYKNIASNLQPTRNYIFFKASYLFNRN